MSVDKSKTTNMSSDESDSVPDGFFDEENNFGGARHLPEDKDLEYNKDDDGCNSQSTSTGMSTTTKANTNRDEEEDNENSKLEFAKRETKAVLRLRLLVFDFLIVATIGVSILVYVLATRAEESEYESQYDSAANTVIEAFMDIAHSKLAAVAGLGVTLTVHGEEHQSQWPFLTLTRFQERAATSMTQSGALYLQVNPLVVKSQRREWEQYVAGNDSFWIEEGLEHQDQVGMLNFTGMPDKHEEHAHLAERWPIWFHNLKGLAVTDKGHGPYLPTWQTTPIVYNGQEVNENILKSRRAYIGANESFSSKSVVVDQFMMAPPGDMHSEDEDTSMFALLLGIKEQEQVRYPGDPLSQVFFPVFDTLDKEDQNAAGVMVAWIRWMNYFDNLLPETVRGIFFVLEDSCGGNYTYVMNGKDVEPVGEGDQHPAGYSDMARTASFQSVTAIDDGTEGGRPIKQDRCSIAIRVYPSNEFHSIYNTNIPAFMTAAVVIIFLCTALLFILYDRLVERRQKLVMASAEQTNAIVSSLFPKQVRDRLLQQPASPETAKGKNRSFLAPNRRLKGYLSGMEDDVDEAPIADLFPHCTVLFADIAGFTAWSSTRDPAQVFILLQTVYQAFDKIAQRRKVFKVETIGDTYVAVTGLPEPQSSHVVIMARFAVECRIKVNEVLHELETRLGPDTADLAMRFGMHSGPVTAGVLRGDRARFQLFGDTVNTAARMESTGIRDEIQISHASYGLLVEAGKQGWAKPRDDCVLAKGKGTLRTYWVQINGRSSGRRGSNAGSTGLLVSSESLDTSNSNNMISISAKVPSSVSTLPSSSTVAAKKQARLVNWMVELFKEHIQKIVAQRKPSRKTLKVKYTPKPDQTCLDEVAEVIYLPRFDAHMANEGKAARHVQVPPVVVEQLHQFISTIASSYHANPFHNFEHACHVALACDKFLKRIAQPDLGGEEDREMAAKLHDYTHGVNNDPLTLFAIVVSALIHDVDHRGVSNAQLATENPEMGEMYHQKSIAEQHSLDLAWNCLMGDEYEALRMCLFTSEAELMRFRQVLVNVVLATDIFDPELNGLRKKRWEKAFSSSISEEENHDLRATIVIEHIIQAADVSHTMQHWHIYRKWNRRLFMELHKAFREGRMAKDPSTFWYQGEIGFFDNYVIPLAKKLKDCQVFGVSSDECLNYAVQNRDEWKEKGEDIVAEMIQEVICSDSEETTGIQAP